MTDNEIIKFLQSKQIPQCGDKEYTADEEYEAYQGAINALEQTTWIPVREKLPEEKIAVLVWCPERKNIYCACLEENQWWIFGAYFQKVEFEVIAWMPLPEPYKGE